MGRAPSGGGAPLTVKSLKTRFREPLRRAMRAALGWFTIALGFCCAGVLPASDEDLRRQEDTDVTHTRYGTLVQPDPLHILGRRLVGALRLLLLQLEPRQQSLSRTVFILKTGEERVRSARSHIKGSSKQWVLPVDV